jgi:hypothetical protein
VAKDDIHTKLWPSQVVSDATLIGLIKEIRRAFRLEAPDMQVIRTVHRVGYAFDAAIEPNGGAGKVAGLLFLGARRAELLAQANLIGRNPDCAVWLDHATVSREHACIVIESGRATLQDLGSKNGTRVNGEAVKDSHDLQDGDKVQFGEVAAVFRNVRSFQPTRTQATQADL